jgi:outer-membrane receptor for ferric coprogen and ferric-rhodotorulic acid
MYNNATSRRSRLGRLSLLTASILLASSLHAQEARHTVNLPAQPLDQALNALARQTGTRILFATDIAAGLQGPAIKGEVSVDQALQQLLQGSSLNAEKTADGSFVVAEPFASNNALDLGTITIQGQGMGQMTEGSGSYTPSLVSAGSKTPTSLRQTPQTVSVITHQVIEDKQVRDLGEALQLTPGITVLPDGPRTDAFYSRGFLIENIQIDGAAPMALGTSSGSFYSNKNYNMAEFDHVEVLRGASGLFGGTGDPGGIINLVRKRPLDAYQLKFESSAGTWDNYYSQLDVTGPLAFDGALRGRLVTAYSKKQSFMDEVSGEEPTVYGVLEADITERTRLTVGGRYDHVNQNGGSSGLPRYSNGADLKLSRSTSLTQDWAVQRGRSEELFVKLDHEFSDDWKANVTYTRTQDAGIRKGAFTVGAVNPATGTGPIWLGSTTDYHSNQALLDVNLAGTFDWFGRQQELLLGADHQKITSRWRGAGQLAGAFGNANVFDPGSTPWAKPAWNTNWLEDYKPNAQEQYGMYSTLRLHLLDPLHVILGARAQRYKFEQVYREYNSAAGQWQLGSPPTELREPTKLVPYGGVVYDLNDQWSAYASYSEIFKPQQNKKQGPEPGSPIEAMTGKTYETGIKGELFGGALNTSFGLYYTKRQNEAVEDPTYPPSSFLFASSCCYRAQGEVISKGIDIEVSGEVLPDWNVIAGYTYNFNRNRDDNATFSSITPKHLFKVWSTYRLPGELNALKLGGGVNIQSANYVSGSAGVIDGEGNPVLDASGSAVSIPFDYTQSGYAVWNAMAEYQLDENWSITYNLNNAFDKTYYAVVGSSALGNTYGEPRNHMLTLRGTFW